MSEGIRPFTSTTAPRQGGKPGRRHKLSAQALEILDRLLVDWAKHAASMVGDKVHAGLEWANKAKTGVVGAIGSGLKKGMSFVKKAQARYK